MNENSEIASIDAIVTKVDTVFRNARRQCFPTRSRVFQEEMRNEIVAIRHDLNTAKARFVKAQDARAASVVLGLEFSVRAVFNELGMWLALRDEQPDSAWDCLIWAQQAGLAATRTAIGEGTVKDYCRWLDTLELMLFPRQLFCSGAHKLTGYTCTICEGEYGDCGHVVGKVYMGEMCSRTRVGFIDADHVAIVPYPRDKRCRAHTKVDGKILRNAMTWEVVGSAVGEDNRLVIQDMTIMCADGPPGD